MAPRVKSVKRLMSVEADIHHNSSGTNAKLHTHTPHRQTHKGSDATTHTK